MSKLFPMFKRKGKSKEEEVEEESKKRHIKASKHLKDHHQSPSPIVASDTAKPIKKRKAKEGKRKAPIPGEKENKLIAFNVEAQRTRDFYVDDSGSVRQSLSQHGSKEHHEGDIYEDDSSEAQFGPCVQLAEDSLLARKDDLGTYIHDTYALEMEIKPEVLDMTNGCASPGGKQSLDVSADTSEHSLQETLLSDGHTDKNLTHSHLNSSEKEIGMEEVLNENILNAQEVHGIAGEKTATSSGDLEANQEPTLSKSDIHLTSDAQEDVHTASDAWEDVHTAGDTHEDVHTAGDTHEDVHTAGGTHEDVHTNNANEGSHLTSDAFEKEVESNNSHDVNSIGRTEVRDYTGEEMVVLSEVEDAPLPEEDSVMMDDNQKKEKEGETNECPSGNAGKQRDDVIEHFDEVIKCKTVENAGKGSEFKEVVMGDFECGDETKDSQEGSVLDENSQVDEDGLHSIQESEDDFDSAQEEWDEEESSVESARERTSEDTGKVTSQECIQSTFLNHFEESDNDGEVNEAANNVLITNKCKEMQVQGIVREPSSSSSIYGDAPSNFEDCSSAEISSIIDASNEDCTKDSSQDDQQNARVPFKLARKTSNISTASSDIFDEELDGLLDEELDRLSEEEVESINNKVPQGQSSDVVTVNGIGKIEPSQRDESTVEVSRTVERTKEEGETTVNTDVEIMVQDQSGEINEVSVHGSMSNTSKDSNYLSKITEESKCSEESIKTSILVTPEECLDQVRDSGYYSLPVSPKPGVAVRPSEVAEEGVQLASDSFADSEEEGMVTPPNEVLPVVDEAVVPTSKIREEKENVLDSSVNNESNILYQSCNENQEAEIENVDKLAKQVSKASEEGSQDISVEMQINSKPVYPKLNIGKDVTTAEPKDGSASPRGGSTPTRHSRHKSPLVECENKQQSEESLLSPDPVGDRFLEQAVFVSHQEAEARLAQRRAARAEARELRLRELEKLQQDQENDEEKQFGTPTYPEPSPRSGVTGRTSVRTAGINSTGQYSRRSSEDSTTDESLPANVREMRAELKELDEKFRKAMITNAQLDNEKATLTYEVELMKDKYTELEETHTQLTKEHRKKCTEYEQLRKVSTKLQEEVKALRSLLQERDQLIQEYGLVVVGEDEENGEEVESEKEDVDDLSPRKIFVKKALISQEAAELLAKGAAKGSLDVRLKKFGEEKNDLEDQVRRLKLELEEEQNKNRRRENGLDYEKQKEQSKTVNEYKFRVQKAEAEVSTLQANDIGEGDSSDDLHSWRAVMLSTVLKVARLDALSTRYKIQSEELEKSEEELKLEKRKLQRELREAQSRLEEVETTNNHLIKRFDKLKNARSTLLKDLSQDPA
ncbi:putative leucine-rich repeat-containing protein DDB_G0290503 isoform X3 [Cherax quadricarinatus]|uniref:putative leucine-rich repeat-containing protein DDB_G0290503 isoform X3 n=1 Tax=Cherax quadricarinatus TaxID=27406 RepID=UPI00387E9AD7